MIIQRLQFPDSQVCTRENMYFKGEHYIDIMGENRCILREGSRLAGNTYFNSFSIGKWRKYTKLDNLQLHVVLSGDVLVHVRYTCKMNNTVKNFLVAETSVFNAKKEDVCVSIPLEYNTGMYYFELKALSDNAEFFGGAFETQINEEELRSVKMAIGICTFRRETYVAHNMDILRRYILENPNSPLYGNLEIYISDNSQTLDPSMNTDTIHIFPNRNLGGAGGFTRSMIEIKKDSAGKGFSHLMMMDDDVRLNPDSLVRTYTMLRLMKKAHWDAFIGGHMLKIDTVYIQSEAADHWDIASHHPVKYNYNLEKTDMLIKNEIEDSVNYLSWWYCCMPIDVVTDSNLPLPIFIKRDDIEYGLRNGKTFITLNGICVWHEPFEYKYATYLEYYYFRNMCIMNSRHRLSFTKERLIKEMRKRILGFLMRYRYRDAELSLLGIQHYLNGIDWLKRQDGEGLNKQIMQLGYKKEPVENLDFVFVHGQYERNICVKERRTAKAIRYLTLNGWLCKAKKTVVVPAYQPSSALFNRAAKVINYEEISNSAFITYKSWSSLFYILKMYLKTVSMIKQGYDRVTREYRNRYNELTNLDFWNQYLYQPGEVPNIQSGLDKTQRPKNTKTERKTILMARIMLTVQALLFWLPVKKNRVMVYVHDRKGFTCNPKYVVLKLKELYGNKLEIIWASMYPETCQEIRDLGVKVIKSNSADQFKKYLRTRFFITNDAFPTWAMHRRNQKWMNTWHGAMNYKHIGYDYLAPMSKLNAKLFRMKNRQPDFYLSGSGFFTEDTAKSFRLSESVFVPSGLPRNDVLFGEHKEIVEKVKKYYHIAPEKHIVMFAPTFRRGMKSETFGLDFKMVCDALAERFGGEWVMLFRSHNFVKGKQTHSGAIDASGYHDMQELMCAADVLISDYSSCLYDFCMTGKPSFVYATDLDSYRSSDRSFAYPFEKWPYPVAQSNDELLTRIRELDLEEFKQKVADHLIDAQAYDNGTASEQAAKLVEKYCL